MRHISQIIIGFIIAIFLFNIQPSSAGEIIDSKVALTQALEKHKGKVIYLDFWASWCGPCRKSFPWMNSVQEKFQQQGFIVISINLDAEYELAQQFLTKNPASFPVIYDPKGKLAKELKVQGMPTSLVFNRKGEIIYRHTGFFIKKIQSYEQEITRLLKESK